MADPSLLPEDDDLLSYFLSTEINTQPDPSGDSATMGMRNMPVPVVPQRFTSFNTGGVASNTPQYAAFGAPAQNQIRKPMGMQMPPTTMSQPSLVESPQDATSPAKIPLTGAGGSFPSSISSQSQVQDGTMDEDERRQRRLARNRESARQSRRRKKQYLELLEEKVSQLTEEIANFRRMHLESCGSKLNALKLELIKSLEDRISASESDQETALIHQELDRGRKMIQQRFGPNCEERQIVTEYHFQQLFSLLLPPYTKFLLWLSIQNDDFFKATSTNSKFSAGSSDGQEGWKQQSQSCTTEGLWPLLSNELGLTFEQEEKLKSHYRAMESKASRAERRRLAIAMVYLERLRTTMAQRAAAVQNHSDQIHNILTPAQSIKYSAWLEKNRDRLRHAGLGKGFACANATANAGESNDKIGAILKKSDQDLTVEDITEMLSALSQQTVSSPSS